MPNRTKIKLKDIRKPHERLTFAEFHVASMTARAVPRKEACSKLGIHRTTYLRTLYRALRKMGLKGDTDLRAYDYKHGVF